MGFWQKVFSSLDSVEKTKTVNRLHEKLVERLPNESEQELAKIACIAGLMSRVAHADLVLKDNEISCFANALTQWTELRTQEIEHITQLALDEVKELVGLENHLYTNPLRELLNRQERFELLEALFTIAASDGECENIESEEIRVISKGLGLGQREFIAARATVHDKLSALRG